ncbi:MAG TPA: CAP domain-containing protein [Spirochaetota bacterium]|nr:CAP domain-containing protein [Spirochaetota bacterium]
MINLKRYIFIVSFIVIALNLFSQGLDITKIEKEIFRIVNLERSAVQLDPLRYDEKLADMARMHSDNMVKLNFFSHTGKDGTSPQQRKLIYYKELLGGIGENIAYNFGNTEEEAAQKLMTAWMNSSGHKANILSKKYSHIGVGISLSSDGKIYGTQNFSESQAKYIGELPLEYSYGETAKLKFEFLGKFPKDKLTIFVHFPDKNAKYYTKSGSFYTGLGLFEPIWQDDTTFYLEIKCDKGKGNYKITMGSYGSFYPEGLDITVK